MEQLQLQCSKHQLSLGDVLFQSYSSQQLSNDPALKCFNCIIEQKLNEENLLSFLQLQISATQSCNPFVSLPLDLNQQGQIKYFQDKYSSQNFAQIRQQIQDFFSNFLKDFAEKIHSLQKQALRKLDQNEQNLQQLFYPESFSSFKQKLYSVILVEKGDSDSLNKEINSLIQAYQEASSKKFMRIKLDLKDLQNQLFQFSEKQSNILRDRVLQQLENIEEFLEYEKDNYLKEIEFIGSERSFSKQAKIIRYEDGEVMIKNPTFGHITAYSNFIIDPNLKYLITVEVRNSKKNGHQMIGLIEDEFKEIKLIQDFRLAFNNANIFGLTKQIKGECFTKKLRNVERFELQIQICLKDKLFIVSDFPENNSIFALEEAAIQDKKYRLGVELYYANDSITIRQIEIVSFFPYLL